MDRKTFIKQQITALQADLVEWQSLYELPGDGKSEYRIEEVHSKLRAVSFQLQHLINELGNSTTTYSRTLQRLLINYATELQEIVSVSEAILKVYNLAKDEEIQYRAAANFQVSELNKKYQEAIDHGEKFSKIRDSFAAITGKH